MPAAPHRPALLFPPQVGFAGSEVAIKDEPDACPSVAELVVPPALSNLAPPQYRALLQKRFTENKDNVLGFLGTYKDRLEGELQFLTRSAASSPHPPLHAQPCHLQLLMLFSALRPQAISILAVLPLAENRAAGLDEKKRKKKLSLLLEAMRRPRPTCHTLIVTTKAQSVTATAPPARTTSARLPPPSTKATPRLPLSSQAAATALARLALDLQSPNTHPAPMRPLKAPPLLPDHRTPLSYL